MTARVRPSTARGLQRDRHAYHGHPHQRAQAGAQGADAALRVRADFPPAMVSIARSPGPNAGSMLPCWACCSAWANRSRAMIRAYVALRGGRVLVGGRRPVAEGFEDLGRAGADGGCRCAPDQGPQGHCVPSCQHGPGELDLCPALAGLGERVRVDEQGLDLSADTAPGQVSAGLGQGQAVLGPVQLHALLRHGAHDEAVLPRDAGGTREGVGLEVIPLPQALLPRCLGLSSLLAGALLESC